MSIYDNERKLNSRVSNGGSIYETERQKGAWEPKPQAPSSISKQPKESLGTRLNKSLNPFKWDEWDADEYKQKVSANNERRAQGDISETERFVGRTLNSALLGIPGELAKRGGDPVPELQARDGVKNNTLDFTSSALGYLVPGVGAVKGLRAAGLGAKTTKGMSTAKKGLQYGKEGALVGAGISGAEVGIREGLNPDDYNYKDNLTKIGLETAGGAIADPALMGLGKLIGKGVNASPKLKAILDKFKKGDDVSQDIKDPEVQQEIKLLNAPQQQLDAPKQRVSQEWDYKAPQQPNTKEGLTLPEPMKQTRIQAQKQPNYYTQRLEELSNLSKNQNLSPGRESETLESLWSGIAKENDPSLDKLIDLGTPSKKMDQLRNNPTDVIKQARKNQKNSVYGLDNMFNKINKQPEYIKTPEVEGNPLEFKRDLYNRQRTKVEEPLNFTRKLNPNETTATRAEVQTPKINLDSLQYGDKIAIQQGRGESKPLTFVKRTDGQVVAQNSKGKEVVIPEKLVVSKKDYAQPQGFKDPLEGLKKSLNKETAATKEEYLNIDPEPKGNGGPLKRADSNPRQKIDKNTSAEDVVRSINTERLKDVGEYETATTDVFRLFKKVFKDDETYQNVKRSIIEPFEQAKADYTNMQQSLLKDLRENLVDKYGIKKGSKESRLVQMYGEKEINLEDLKKQAPEKWEDIVEADKWFRNKYDTLIDEVNDSIKKIYPEEGAYNENKVPKRDDYYRHFRELQGFSGLKNIFDSPSSIDPTLAGTSQYTKPNTKWASFKQERGLGEFKRDAVGGFLEYIPAASYATKIDPVIPKFRKFQSELADKVKEVGKTPNDLNNFLEFMVDYTNDLSGKTNPIDRIPQKYIPGGRKTFAALNWLNSRVKSNVILGNLSSVIAQTANIPLGASFAKQHSVPGVKLAIRSLKDTDAPIYKSDFMKERYLDKSFREFDERLFDQPRRLASALLEFGDKFGANFIWNSAYAKGKAQGVKNPIKYADEQTRRLVAGRGIGEIPLAQKSKTVQLIAPFTLEVGNQWKVMKEMLDAKDLGGFATLFVANYFVNKIAEEVRGNGVTFDPIDAIIDAFIKDNDLSTVEKFGRVGGEVLSNTPFGSYAAGFYPEYGNDFLPSREEMFGDRNPQRFGTGLLVNDSYADPIFKFATPFGGNQLRKTSQGINNLLNGGNFKEKGGIPYSENIPGVGKPEELRYPIENNLENTLKSALFGSSATDEAQEYYKNEGRALSIPQTKQYKQEEQRGRGKEFYDQLMYDRRVNTLQSRIKDIRKDQNLTKEEKEEGIDKLIKRLKKLKEER